MKSYEATEIDYVCDYLDRITLFGKLNGVFVDIGAHVGLWSLSMSEWYINRYAIVPIIYALEPESKNFMQLCRNAQQSDTGIRPVQAAAWNKNTHLFLKTNENPGRHQVIDVKSQQAQMMRVQAVALDNVVRDDANRQIDAIKIDVEGAELQVLNGARGIFDANKNLLVVVEYSIEHLAEYGTHPNQITGFMQMNGFTPARELDKHIVETICVDDLKRVIFIKGDLS
jgi:FkbM family methyltransferase